MSEQSNSSHISNHSKRKHSVEDEIHKKHNSEEVVHKSEIMDARGRGRGRGSILQQNLSRLKTEKMERESTASFGQKPTVGPNTEPKELKPSYLTELGGDCLQPKDEASRNRLKEAEERSGMTIDIINEFFRIGGNVGALLEEKGLIAKPQPVFKQEAKTDEEIDIKEEKKYNGRQYVEKAKEKERARVIQTQKEEFLRQKASTSKSTSGSNLALNRRFANRGLNTSLDSLTTDLESIGTFNPQIPETIEENEDQIHQLIHQYFGQSKPQRVALPIAKFEDKIVSAVKSSRVVVIEGATGCGKTTQVPQYIADDFAQSGLPFNIVVTQPRRIAAKSIAARVADERGWQLGTIVGYQIGMDREHVNEDTRLLYCTTGVLLQRLINTQRMDNYSHIIIDEVHERSIETDLLLLVIRRLMMTTGMAVRIILMSATFDAQKLMDYFSIPIYSVQNDEEILTNTVMPSHIRIEERPNKMNIFYLDQIKRDFPVPTAVTQQVNRFDPFESEKDNPNVSYDSMEVAIAILEKGLEKIDEGTNTRGSVLVFLPGLDEIHEFKARLDRSPVKTQNQWKIYPLHSSVPLDKQNDIFRKPLGNTRKIILATNIAESSITVPDVSYVIDFCLTKNMVCDLETHIPVLRMEWAAKSNCDQRAGRCGRVSEGRVYRLVRKEFYNSFLEFGYPELVRSPLDLSILRVKMLNMGPPKELLGLALDPPDLSDIYHSVLQLKQVGAFTVKITCREGPIYDEEDGDITTLGIIMSHLPIDIRLGKLVVMGHVFDCLEDCIIIAACLSTQGMFRREFNAGIDAYKSRLAWADRSFSDSIAYLNAYKMFKSFETRFPNKQLAEKWCKQNFLQHKRILEADYMVGEIKDRLRRENINVPNRPNLKRKRTEEELILKVVMCAAFYPNYFLRNDIDLENVPKTLGTKDPYSSVAVHGFPQNQGVIYAPQIRQIFSKASKHIDLAFEDTKAYLTFLEDNALSHPLKEAHDLQQAVDIDFGGRDTPMSVKSESSVGPVKKAFKDTAIKTAVYVSIAMKKHREVRDIVKYNPEVAKMKLEQINKELQVKKEEDVKWRKLYTNRVSVPNIVCRVKLSKLPLPAVDCSEIEIRITHIENPSNFYAHYYTKTTDTYLNELSKMITYDLETIPCDDSTIRFGDLVIAPFKGEDGSLTYGRARVDNILYKGDTKEIKEVEIFFIDYGFKLDVNKISNMSQITTRANERLTSIPPQAFRCQLSQVNPSAVSSSDSCWNRKSIHLFKSFVKKHNTLTAKIYSVVNRVVRLELFENENREQSINDRLISSGYAEKWEEDIQSKLNHEHRRRALLSRGHTRGKFHLETDDKEGIFPEDVIEIEVDEELPSTSFGNVRNLRSHDKLQLRGPFSPLEVSFTGLTKKTSNRAVKIERDSVNCVVLEPDYLSKHTRLLVASNIGLGHTQLDINLRNTTLMPNIRGFPALMTLMFAPRAQFRVDKDNTEYVGVICGLGFDPITQKAYDPDSDAEVIFDTDISREDAAKVNIIRYHISDLLKSREALLEFAEGTLAIKQRKIRRLIVELLDRRRRLQNFSSYHPNYKWTRISDETTDDSVNSSNDSLLPIIPPLKMKDFDWFEDIRENLDQLKNIEKGSLSMATKCKLCKVTAYSFHDINHHLNSNEHNDRVIDFNRNYKINESEKLKEHFYKEREDFETENPKYVEIFDSDEDE